MSGQSVASEVDTALAEVAQEVGAGSFTVTLIRSPVDEPTTPWGAPGGSPTEFSLLAMLDEWNKNEIDGTLIRATDKKVMVSATGAVPTVADRLVISGVDHAIMAVTPEAPGGVALNYVIHARQ